MDVPTSEVGCTSAMPRREDHEVHKDMWGIEKEDIYIYTFLCFLLMYFWFITKYR